jgi:hypothetical protein
MEIPRRCQLCGELSCILERAPLVPTGAQVQYSWLANTFAVWGGVELELCPTCFRMLNSCCIPSCGAVRSNEDFDAFCRGLMGRAEQVRRAADEVQKGNIKSVAELERIGVERIFCPGRDCPRRELLGKGCVFPQGCKSYTYSGVNREGHGKGHHLRHHFA